MSKCGTIKGDGQPCTNTGKPEYGGRCGVHKDKVAAPASQPKAAPASQPASNGTCGILKGDGQPCTNTGKPEYGGRCGVHKDKVAAPASQGDGSSESVSAPSAPRATRSAQGSALCPVVKKDMRLGDDNVLRIKAESMLVESIAPGYAPPHVATHSSGAPSNIIQISTKDGQMLNRDDIRDAVPDASGNYLWTLTAPTGRRAVAVYCGQAGDKKQTLKGRIGADYVNADFFGPKGSPSNYHKRWPMMEAMARGFVIHVRFRVTEPGLATEEEARTLGAFDFALNDQKNGGRRPIFMHDGKEMLSFPVLEGVGKIIHKRIKEEQDAEAIKHAQ